MRVVRFESQTSFDCCEERVPIMRLVVRLGDAEGGVYGEWCVED